MVSDDAESIYETLEVLRSGYTTLPVAIDIGHQSQGHYHGSDEPCHYSISFYGFFGHDEAIGAVISSIRLSCHEIRAFLFKGYW